MSKSAEGKITNNKNKDWCQDWCVKFAEHHEPTKGKKKKKTDKQRNSDQIYYEYQLYSNSCSSGRGVWCPDIPDLRLRPYGEVEHNGQKYRYLIMEKIKHEVFKGCKSTSDVVDRTVQVLMALKEVRLLIVVVIRRYSNTTSAFDRCLFRLFRSFTRAGWFSWTSSRTT